MLDFKGIVIACLGWFDPSAFSLRLEMPVVVDAKN